ncbi:MAG: phosphatidylglycerophosphatase A [Methylococcales bacterium]|nr:phosphatidylglycerophosphatase A [Methylococcales bacterium]
MTIFLENYGKTQLTPKQIIRDPILFLAFGFGSGLVKKAPGTMGTVAAIPVYWVMAQFNIWIFCLLTLIITLVGIWICDEAAKKLEVHDFGGIVWDEIAGYLITMAFTVAVIPFSWPAIIVGFLLFRFFDILKPQPIKWVDSKVEGGLGIMLDDVIAGLFAGIILFFIF